MALTKKKNANWWYYEWDASDFNLNKGITTGLDSSATIKPQPSWTMNSGNNTIPWANPSEPSTNNATRREKYNIETQGGTVPENTKIGAYDTVSPIISTDRWTTSDSDTRNQYTWYIKKIKWNSFITPEYERLQQEIERSLKESGIDTTKEIYGAQITEAVNNALQAEISEWAYQSQLNQITNKQAYNIQLVNTLTRETRAAISQGKSIQEIADALGQDPRVIQKIANNEQAELIQLSQEYEDEQMRSYIRNKEDMDIQIARNITQYKNLQTNLDYQFDSAMTTLRRNLFDSEWTARGTAAWLGMTGTKYLLDRIQTQYDQQKADLQNTYDYQSANAQIAINNALEDYTLNINRWMEDYASAIKELQGYVWTEFQKASNNLALSTDQKLQILSGIKANVEEMKANAIMQYASALEDWNNTLANVIANAYGLDTGSLTTHQFTSSELGRTSTSTIWNDTNNLWHILSSDDGMRIWTYKSPNGYTYNVYATREEWLLATQGLLQRAYYGKTLRQAAQKWIGQGKDISSAISVIKSLWLNPDEVLSDSNVRKFMEAIWRWEWTIKKWETLDDWLKGWKDLSSYWTSSEWTATGWEWWWNYISTDSNLYKAWNTEKWLTEAQMKWIKQDERYGSTEAERIANFTKAAQSYYDNVTKGQQAKTFQDSLDILVEFYKYWNKLTPTQQTMIKKLWTSEFIKRFGYSDDINNMINLYDQIKAQGFIDKIVTSKQQWASYWPLSDNEWWKITAAANSLNLDSPGAVQGTVEQMMSDLAQAITELWWTPDLQSWKSRNIWNFIYNPESQNAFNVPWVIYSGSNLTWAQQSWTVNTWAAPVWQK